VIADVEDLAVRGKIRSSLTVELRFGEENLRLYFEVGNASFSRIGGLPVRRSVALVAEEIPQTLYNCMFIVIEDLGAFWSKFSGSNSRTLRL
jgi:hypothetical protein